MLQRLSLILRYTLSIMCEQPNYKRFISPLHYISMLGALMIPQCYT